MSKFSQGKWYVDSAGVLRCDDDYDRSIAHFITSAATKELDEANARLITAAPEMYRLLDKCVDELVAIGLSEECYELLNRIDGKEEQS